MSGHSFFRAIPPLVVLSCRFKEPLGFFPKRINGSNRQRSAIIGLPFQRRDRLMPNCQSRNKITCLFSVDGRN
ncbi:hypothetical protein T05_15188 [Trichinella murrelli]|uniref:Uncharacterized protein n=1 Tax=Trichinella murrelli TaxID=144512 RepID=A0A0V0U3L8_9BILA|nr:hypothetical protein T05_15188 [Trichinella murrelli]